MRLYIYPLKCSNTQVINCEMRLVSVLNSTAGDPSGFAINGNTLLDGELVGGSQRVKHEI